jgi:hypothetical protein
MGSWTGDHWVILAGLAVKGSLTSLDVGTGALAAAAQGSRLLP